MSGNCATCKHWTQQDLTKWDLRIRLRRAEGESDLALDERTRTVEARYGICKGVPEVPDESEFEPPPLAFTMDASEYKAALYTQALFGCVLHEERVHVQTVLRPT